MHGTADLLEGICIPELKASVSSCPLSVRHTNPLYLWPQTHCWESCAGGITSQKNIAKLCITNLCCEGEKYQWTRYVASWSHGYMLTLQVYNFCVFILLFHSGISVWCKTETVLFFLFVCKVTWSPRAPTPTVIHRRSNMKSDASNVSPQNVSIMLPFSVCWCLRCESMGMHWLIFWKLRMSTIPRQRKLIHISSTKIFYQSSFNLKLSVGDGSVILVGDF